MHECMYACMPECVYACMHVYMYACLHECVYACMHVCMNECMIFNFLIRDQWQLTYLEFETTLGNKLETEKYHSTYGSTRFISDKLEKIESQLDQNHKDLEEKYDGLLESINEMKSKIIENLVKENAQLFAKVKYLESKVVDLEESHENMDVRIIQIEKESNANFQYQRGTNLELHGIPNEINDEKLEVTVLGILNAIDVPCNASHLQRCHRLPGKNGSSKPTIIKLTNQRYIDMAHKNKKLLNKTDLSSIDIKGNIYINYNLTPKMKNLAFNLEN